MKRDAQQSTQVKRLFEQCPLVATATHLVIRDLLQEQMGVVLDGHSSVAVVITVEGRPGEPHWFKRVDSLMTALQTPIYCFIFQNGVTSQRTAGGQYGLCI